MQKIEVKNKKSLHTILFASILTDTGFERVASAWLACLPLTVVTTSQQVVLIYFHLDINGMFECLMLLLRVAYQNHLVLTGGQAICIILYTYIR